MDERMGGSRRRRGPATPAALATALLLAAWAWTPRERAAAEPHVGVPSIASSVSSAALHARADWLTALAQCSACHPSGRMPDDTQLALASLPQPPVGARAAAARDDALVRLGADVYLIACAGCHADGHAASGAQRGARGASLHVARGRTVPAPAPDRLADAPMRARGGNAPVLSDEQIAALAAFLQRHATAIGPVRLDRPSTML